MADFTLDTSGAIYFATPYAKAHGLKTFYRWPDLSLFTQGYVEAAHRWFCEHHQQTCRHLKSEGLESCDCRAGRWTRFDQIHPETIAAMMKDCELSQSMAGGPGNHEAGEYFWHERQQGLELRFPPLTLFFDDEGKVRQTKDSG